MKKVPLFSSGNAVNSLRSSGFDFCSAIGEVVDNSLQATNVKNIYIFTNNLDNEKSINEVVIEDDGCGMEKDILHSCLRLGYSTRYGDRSGIGRFGVGATLAAISQCRRIEIFSKTAKSKDFNFVYVDLDEIKDEDVYIGEPIIKNIKNERISNHGTIVKWSKCDKLKTDANGKFLNKKKIDEELLIWLERTYRKFIEKGINIFLNNNKIFAFDPLFLDIKLTRFPKDKCSKIIFEDKIEWPIPGTENLKSEINIKMTLLDPELRQERYDGDNDFAKIRRIEANEGVSVLRNSREVAYGNFYPMVPQVDRKDRYWGLEISFLADLDECWDVKNVKRGARPTEELRETIRKMVSSSITAARNEISLHWDKIQAEKEKNPLEAKASEELVAKAEKLLKPKSNTKSNTNSDEKKESIEEITNSPVLPPEEKEVLVKKLNDDSLPITVSTTAMSGPDFFITRHIGNGKVHVELNYSHPFFKVYNELKDLENNSTDEISTKIRKARTALEMLIMAFGRAESMLDMDEPITERTLSTLRTFWGTQLKHYVSELIKK